MFGKQKTIAAQKFINHQKVFYLDSDKIIEAVIYGSLLLKDKYNDRFEWRYFLELKDEVKQYGWVKEEKVFETREGLIKSL